jgi:hypothetical protein
VGGRPDEDKLAGAYICGGVPTSRRPGGYKAGHSRGVRTHGPPAQMRKTGIVDTACGPATLSVRRLVAAGVSAVLLFNRQVKLTKRRTFTKGGTPNSEAP